MFIRSRERIIVFNLKTKFKMLFKYKMLYWGLQLINFKTMIQTKLRVTKKRSDNIYLVEELPLHSTGYPLFFLVF